VLLYEQRQLPLKGSVYLALWCPDQHYVQGTSHVRLQNQQLLAVLETTQKLSENYQQTLEGRRTRQVFHQTGPHLPTHLLAQHLQHRRGRTPQQFSFLSVGFEATEKEVFEFEGKFCRETSEVVLEGGEVLAIEKVLVEVEGVPPVAEHFQDDFNEAEVLVKYLHQVLLAAVVLEDLDGQEPPNDPVGQKLPPLQPKQLTDEDQTDLRVLINLCDFLNYLDHCPQVGKIPEHPDQDALQTVFEYVLGFLGSSVFPLDDLLPDRNPKFNRLHDEVQDRHRLAGLCQLHGLQFVYRLLSGCPQQSLSQIRPSGKQLFELFNRFREADPHQRLYILELWSFREVSIEDDEERDKIFQLVHSFVEFANESEDVS
jgi:hypothetical protein